MHVSPENDWTVLVIDNVGVEEHSAGAEMFNVYPNLSQTGNFKIDLSEILDLPVFYEDYSIKGKLNEKKNIKQSNFKLSIKDTKGMYLLNVHSNSSVSTQMSLLNNYMVIFN